MVAFIERYILQAGRGVAIESGRGEELLFQVYNHTKAPVYARRIQEGETLRIWKYHNPTGGKLLAQVFAFEHKPWPDGRITHDPVSEGDCLCYIPAHDGVRAEVYQIEGSAVSDDGSGFGRCKYFRKCTRTGRTLEEGDKVRARQWYPGVFDSDSEEDSDWCV